MPGLVGIVSEKAVDEQLLNRMIDSIKHEDFYRIDKYINLHFGIARVHLGIFNPEPQPIFNEDKSLCIFMDGKIYDYEEEMNRLKEKGYKFSFKNDPEFCLYSYEDRGIDFIKNLNGSFVFVIYDFKENKIIIVNDRYGLRPIYYAINNEKLLFGPEVKAILQDKSFKKELNDEAIADFFAFGEILGNKTFFKGVEVLPSASITVWNGKLSIEQYWDFNYEPDYSKSEDEFVDELVKTFKEAVEIRMKDNLRYGVSLSGGLDSRCVVGAIDKNKRKDVLAFSFGPLDCDEVKIAKKVAKKAGTKFKAIEITPEMIIENAEKELYLSDGLCYIGVSYLISVSNIIRSLCDAVFIGFEGDVVLGGSYLNKEMLKAEGIERLFTILMEERRVFTDEEFNELFYNNEMKTFAYHSLKDALNKVDEENIGNKNDHYLMRNHAIRLILMGHVLIRNYLEDIVPTFDNNFIEIIQKIPPELRFNHRIYRNFLKKLSPKLAKIPYNETMVRPDAPLLCWRVGMYYQSGKELLKKLIRRLSKDKIILPNKRSYVNFNEWLRRNENWKRFFKELLLNEKAISRRYFNQEYIKTLIQQHEAGKANNSMKILYLASFELFLRLFFSNDNN